jgi:hypothetical protein
VSGTPEAGIPAYRDAGKYLASGEKEKESCVMINVDSNTFRAVLGRVATGVAIITTCLGTQRVGEQRDDNDDQLGRLAQPFHHGSSPCAKGVTTDSTARALPLAIMNANGALAHLASCGACRIRAKYLRHVHRFLMFCLHKHILPMGVAFFKSPPLFHQLVGLYRRVC